MHQTCVVERRVIHLNDLISNNSLKLLRVMPQSRMHPWPRCLNCFKIKCNIVRLILLHLTLSSYLINFRHISALLSLLDQMSTILFAWLFCHQSRLSCCKLLYGVH